MFPYFGISLICFAVLFVIGFIFCCHDKRAVRAANIKKFDRFGDSESSGGSFSATAPLSKNTQSVSIPIEDSATEPPPSREREEVERSCQISWNRSQHPYLTESTKTNRSISNSQYPKLDLHGYNKSEACQKAREFYDENLDTRCRGFVIITGQGFHSEYGPQIKPTILNLAKQLEWDYETDKNNKGRVIVHLW